jgi:hypothetical protein
LPVLLYFPAVADVVPTALAKLPADLPVLLIGSPPSYWNQQGAAADSLVAARPGRFVGVILDGGSHADYVQGGNPVMQFIENVLVGFPQPRNIEAAQILAAGWITDMFAGTHDGICSAPGGVFPVDTLPGLRPRTRFRTPIIRRRHSRHCRPRSPISSRSDWAATVRLRPLLRRPRKRVLNGKLHTKHRVIS